MSYATHQDPFGPERATLQDQESHIAWTEARCNRLLRNIASRVEALRKIVQPEISKSRQQPRPKPSSRRSQEHWSAVDPAWLPTGTGKPTGRTYGGKAKPAKSSRLRPIANRGSSRALTIPSPFVERLTQRAPSGPEDGKAVDVRSLDVLGASLSSEGALKPSDDGDHHRERLPLKHRRSRQLPIRPDSEQAAAEQGLLTATGHMLKITSSDSTRNRTGARSLLNTCLRKVPAYIELDEEYKDDCNDDETSDVLGILEDRMSGSKGGGWSGLRDIARSQCIHQLLQAVEECLISADGVFKLVQACCKTSSVSDAEDVLEVFFSGFKDWQPTLVQHLCDSSVPAMAEQRILQSYAQQSDCILAEMIRIPDISRQFLFMAMRSGSPTSDEANLLRQWASLEGRKIVRSAISTPQSKALSKGLLEIFSKFCAMAITSSLVEDTHASCADTSEMLHRFALQVALEHHESDSELLHNAWAQACLLLEALSINASPDRSFLLEAVEAINGHRIERAFRDAADKFTFLLAEDLATLGSQTGQPLVGLLLDRVYESLKREELPAVITQSLQNLASQSVIALSPRAGDSAFEEYEHKVGAIMTYSRRDEPIMKTPHQKETRKWVRWEGEIAEWIARTPFTPAARSSSPSEDQENTAYRETGSSSPGLEVRSPDVLAVTPAPIKRKRRQAAVFGGKRTRQALVEIGGYAHPQVIIPRYTKKRRTWTRIAIKQDTEGSEDELGH